MARPKYKTEWVRVQYWACANPDHRHMTREVAAKCLDKHRRQQRQYHWGASDLALILNRVRNGERQTDIARQLGLSKGRIHQIVARARYKEYFMQRRQTNADLVALAELAPVLNDYEAAVERLRIANPEQYAEQLQKGRL
jgi:hypothetical protein